MERLDNNLSVQQEDNIDWLIETGSQPQDSTRNISEHTNASRHVSKVELLHDRKQSSAKNKQ